MKNTNIKNTNTNIIVPFFNIIIIKQYHTHFSMVIYLCVYGLWCLVTNQNNACSLPKFPGVGCTGQCIRFSNCIFC